MAPKCGLSQAVDILFHPERGRYAVANTDIR